MMVVPIGELRTLEGAWMAMFDIFNVMMFPNDTQEREAFGAKVLVSHISEADRDQRELRPKPEDTTLLDSSSSEEADYATHLEEVKDHLKARLGDIGGFDALVEGRAISSYREISRGRLTDWFTAGRLLGLVRQMATHHQDLRGGASVNKAKYILENSELYPLVHRNSNYITKAWSTYKSVSHFCAALIDFCDEELEKRPNPEDFGSIIDSKLVVKCVEFVSLSESYLRFGLSFKPPHTRGKSLLDPKGTWLLPAERLWPESTRAVVPLTGRLLEVARRYRAPVPGA